MSANAPKAFVPESEFDVFFSYGHIDNSPPEEWVTKLYRRLKTEVEIILGEPVNFFMDPKLKAADLLDATIKQRIAASAAFLPILAPRYMKSPNCRQELDWFLEFAESSRGLNVGTRSRIIPIEKYPAEWPQSIAQLNPISPRFHRTDPTSNRHKTFPADAALPGFEDFYQACLDLAADLAALLEDLKKTALAAPPKTSRYIFLATPTADLKEGRETVANFLRGAGYGVTGDGPPPDTLENLLKWTEEESSRAEMAVHLVGSKYASVPEGEDRKSTEWLQFDCVRAAKKRQLVWVSPIAASAGEKQGLFLRAIDEASDETTEVYKNTSFTEFQDSLPDELAKLSKKAETRDRGVYLLCERSDLSRQQLKDIRKYLEDEGFPVVDPAFQGDPSILRGLEADSVSTNDATIIYYGSAPDSWVALKRRAVCSILQGNLRQPSPIRTVYLCEPPDDIKSNLYKPHSGTAMRERDCGRDPLLVLGDCEAFHPRKLKPLMDILKGRP